MPSTNKTPHLELNQWVGTDKPMREDFNKDNAALDKTIGDPALLARLSALGATNWDSGNYPVEKKSWIPTVSSDFELYNMDYSDHHITGNRCRLLFKGFVRKNTNTTPNNNFAISGSPKISKYNTGGSALYGTYSAAMATPDTLNALVSKSDPTIYFTKKGAIIKCSDFTLGSSFWMSFEIEFTYA